MFEIAYLLISNFTNESFKHSVHLFYEVLLFIMLKCNLCLFEFEPTNHGIYEAVKKKLTFFHLLFSIEVINWQKV